VRRSLLLSFLLVLSALSAPCVAQESLTFGRFGTVVVYRESLHPSHVALFVSGDEGWSQTVSDMARVLSSLDTLVVGIDIRHYRQELNTSPEWCSYPGGDFAALSKFVQKTLGFPAYVLPVLVGYGSGATLVYATLAQAPPDMFRGVLSLGFCPDLPLKKPLCQWYSLQWQRGPQGRGYSLLPAPTLQAPWTVLQGASDQVCNATAVETYVKQIPQAEFLQLPQTDDGFSQAANWTPQLRAAFTKLLKKPEAIRAIQAEAVKDLPLVEIPVTGPGGDTLAVILSGDGGWASIDRELGNTLASRGISVVGLNSLKYFWARRTPEGAAQDLERMLRYYLAAWNKDKALLIGYSLGADVLPFMANRLSRQALSHVQLVALLGPGHRVDFEFHLTNWFWDSPTKTARLVLPEVEKLQGTKTLCFYGEEERDTLCKDLAPSLATVIRLKGGHHFDEDYRAIADTILQDANKMAQ